MRSIKSRLLLKGYKNKQSIITILLALVVMAGQAQQTMTVKDSITNEPIPFVSVYFGNDTGGYTDENGKIAIPNEAAQIRLSHICYETKSISKITADSQTIILVPKRINLDEVAISAKVPKRIKTTEFPTTVLGQKHHTFIPYWQVSITPPIIWFSRKSRIPSMPLSALTSVCQMPRPMPPKTSP